MRSDPKESSPSTLSWGKVEQQFLPHVSILSTYDVLSHVAYHTALVVLTAVIVISAYAVLYTACSSPYRIGCTHSCNCTQRLRCIEACNSPNRLGFTHSQYRLKRLQCHEACSISFRLGRTHSCIRPRFISCP